MSEEETVQARNQFNRINEIAQIGAKMGAMNAKIARAVPNLSCAPQEMCLLERVSVLENQLAEAQARIFDMIHELNIRTGNLETLVRG